MSQKSFAREVPCGCRLCGCKCEEHLRGFDCDDPYAALCPVHACDAILKTIAHEAAALVSLAMLVGCIAVWAVIYQG